MRLCAFLLFAACAEAPVSGVDVDPEIGQAPPPTGATLTRSAAVAGHPLLLRSEGHAPASTVYFGRGAPGAVCPPSLGGGCLDITPSVVLGSATADGEGTAELRSALPARWPAGRTTALQAANAGASPVISNALDLVTETVTACGPGEVVVVRNGDAEVVSDDWYATYGAGAAISTFAWSGAHAFETNGNTDLTQDLTPTAVSDLVSASFWTWHDPVGIWAQSIEWAYTDGTGGSLLLTTPFDPGGWQHIDLLPLLDPARVLSLVRVWGFGPTGGGADIMRADAFAFCAR